MPSPALADVAREAGVSKGTASKALNGVTGVSAGTRERVAAAAAALGWKPSYAARALLADVPDLRGSLKHHA